MSRHRARRLALIAVLIAAGASAGAYRWVRSPPVPGALEKVVIEFPIGTPTRQIFRTMESRKVVHRALAAEMYYRIFRHGAPLRAGEYAFSPGDTLDRTIALLETGEVVRHTVVVPEGATDDECFSLFVSQGIGTEQGFRRASRELDLFPGLPAGASELEGFLFPDTYVVTRSTPTREVLTLMIDNFRRHFSSELARKAAAAGLSERDAVTVASLVEKETSLPEERPHVAAVYLNRLKLGMRLRATSLSSRWCARAWSGRLRRSIPKSTPNTYLTRPSAGPSATWERRKCGGSHRRRADLGRQCAATVTSPARIRPSVDDRERAAPTFAESDAPR